tara:strand:+ start:125 stop:310 length:186 start_codon:yes stop_codon:yes gene_type:complete
MTKSKAFFIRRILELRGEENPDDPELDSEKEELNTKTILELLTLIKQLDGSATFETSFTEF